MFYLILFVWAVIKLVKFIIRKVKHKPSWIPKTNLEIYFGLPGSGKTTYLAWYAKKCYKNGFQVYCNVPNIKNTTFIPFDYIGHVDLDNSVILLDECGLYLDNREYKSNFKDKEVLEFYKYLRHHRCPIRIFSQSVDVDKKVRDLAENYYLVKKSLLPYFTSIVPIKKTVGVDENTKQLVDAYSMPSFLGKIFKTKRIFQPLVWKYFDSWECKKLPSIEEYEATLKKKNMEKEIKKMTTKVS